MRAGRHSALGSAVTAAVERVPSTQVGPPRSHGVMHSLPTGGSSVSLLSAHLMLLFARRTHHQLADIQEFQLFTCFPIETLLPRFLSSGKVFATISQTGLPFSPAPGRMFPGGRHQTGDRTPWRMASGRQPSRPRAGSQLGVGLALLLPIHQGCGQQGNQTGPRAP